MHKRALTELNYQYPTKRPALPREPTSQRLSFRGAALLGRSSFSFSFFFFPSSDPNVTARKTSSLTPFRSGFTRRKHLQAARHLCAVQPDVERAAAVETYPSKRGVRKKPPASVVCCRRRWLPPFSSSLSPSSSAPARRDRHLGIGPPCAISRDFDDCSMIR